jgi:hypothetical protein
MYCQPITASCTCSSSTDGAQRFCFTTNPAGTCEGTQTCSATTGWSACTAPTASTETCDGVDNDCDFVIDDSVGGGEACTIDVTGVGSCPGIRTCNGAAGFVCQGQTPMPETCNFVDDDCDAMVDEAFPTLGDLCTAGVGACLAYGAVTCDGTGAGTECSAVAGSPAPEACNAIDDNCDGATDEAFPTLGDACTAGLGICANYGTVVCTPDTTGSVCSAVPGAPMPTDSCNYLDDDCDGVVDEGFRNLITGFYDQDTTCGSCDIDCTAIYTGPNSFGDCVVSGTPTCVMGCTAGAFDLNASALDGCEFILDTGAIHVSENDPTAVDNGNCGLGPTGTGAGNFPCRTIAQGLSRATTTGRPRVLVADGTYLEAVTLVNGKNMLGGYRSDTWERHVATTSTVIQGVQSVGNHDRTVIAASITSATLFEGFVVRGAFNATPAAAARARPASPASTARRARTAPARSGSTTPPTTAGSTPAAAPAARSTATRRSTTAGT